MKTPCISVVMSVKDGGRHLRLAIDGVLGQTFGDFEFIIIDDGSTDNTSAILDEYNDHRIIRLVNPKTLGLTPSLNKCLKLARGRLMARQDADDISEPRRFAMQVNFLEKHKEVGLVGAAYRLMDANGQLGEVSKQPAEDVEIRWQMLFHNAFCHTSAMIRREVLEAAGGCYDEHLRFAQDYDLWARALMHCRGANLPDPLVRLRLHDENISIIEKSRQQEIATRISLAQLSKLFPGRIFSEVEVNALRQCYYRMPSLLGRDGVTHCRFYLSALESFAEMEQAPLSFVRGHRQNWVKRMLALAFKEDFWFGAGVALRQAMKTPGLVFWMIFSQLQGKSCAA